jgi:hypothetical protein
MFTNDATAQECADRLDDSQYTQHTEPPRVGGCSYWRCVHCGRESTVSKREVLHTEDCQLRRDR